MSACRHKYNPVGSETFSSEQGHSYLILNASITNKYSLIKLTFVLYNWNLNAFNAKNYGLYHLTYFDIFLKIQSL